uniref:Uncharacterized protein n=1 Tax=Myoviridae sp. ct2DO6 TaxID=2825020 RepID=A0A8S5Q1E5_9CAUD|nr:MAG TPA: hypothetical protein [Myoviridae sp. ct2DO6]
MGHTTIGLARLAQYEKFYFCISKTDIDTSH